MAAELKKLCLVAAAMALPGGAAPAGAQVSVDTIRVDVDRHEMVLFVTGRAGPIVVLEPGGSSHRAWGGLPIELATFSRVVTYDRPGYGSSEVCGQPRTANLIATELRQALDAARLEPPFLLAGWSHGGSFMRAFAARFPASATGLLLLDPAIEGFYTRAAEEQAQIWDRQYEEQLERVARSTRGHPGEWAAWDMTMTELRDADQQLRLPITLITSTRDEDGLQYLWIEEHRKWAASVPGVKHILPADVGHSIHRERPDLVKAAIREMLGLQPIEPAR